jgi:hypothetical protein
MVQVKVPSSMSIKKLDIDLAATLTRALLPALQPKCTADTTAAFVAASPMCKKLTSPAPLGPVSQAVTPKPVMTTLCQSVEASSCYIHSFCLLNAPACLLRLGSAAYMHDAAACATVKRSRTHQHP